MNFNTDLYNPTTLGLLKVMEARMLASRKPHIAKYPRYSVANESGIAIHARRCLSVDERQDLDNLIEAINDAPTSEEKLDIMRLIPNGLAKPVKVKRLNHISHGKDYRGKVGHKDRLRAAKRGAAVIDLAA